MIFYSFIELALVTAFAVLYSSFTTPTLSALFTVMTFVIGRMNEDIMRFAWRIQEQGIESIAQKVKFACAWGAAHLTPNLHLFNKSSLVLYGEGIIFDWLAVAYGALYITAILFIATLVFRRKDFK